MRLFGSLIRLNHKATNTIYKYQDFEIVVYHFHTFKIVCDITEFFKTLFCLTKSKFGLNFFYLNMKQRTNFKKAYDTCNNLFLVHYFLIIIFLKSKTIFKSFGYSHIYWDTLYINPRISLLKPGLSQQNVLNFY